MWVGVNFYGSMWVSVNFYGSIWVGVGGCELFMGGCGLVWVSVGRSAK